MTVGLYGTILSSPDGIIWKQQHTADTNSLFSVVYANSQFVAVGEKSAILTSKDGVTWKGNNSLDSNTLYSVAYGNGQL